MSDVDVDIPAQGDFASAPIPFAPPAPNRRWRRRNRDGRPPKPRLRKLRLLLILCGLGVLAFISTVFGMMMAVASDLPEIENITQAKQQVNSYLFDDQGHPIGIFAAPDHAVIDTWPQVNQSMIHAIVAIEDKRFWTDPGVDIRGIARAFLSDVTGGATQGASTIAEQFVKNVLRQENNRTVFEKLREAALAYQLTRRWKRMKIITQYLNTIYFGNGAYGIESAARVYFGKAHGYDASAGPDQPLGACGDPTPVDPTRPRCAAELEPWESALLAGMVANPTAFDPFVHSGAAKGRRDLVLEEMAQQGYITHAQYEQGINEPLPTSAEVQQPAEPPAAPYFTSWLRPQIIAAVEHHDHVPASVAEYRAFYGGLRIRTTIDLHLQEAAQQAIDAEFPPGSDGPTASLVAIDNKTGEVRAMVSGGSGEWDKTQFNLATEAERQPGSAFKVFTLAEALRTGEYTPDSVIDSAPQDIPFRVPGIRPTQHFIVHNFGNTYSGPITLQEATDISDNTVFAQVGVHVGTTRVAELARRMGIRTPVSNNDAMILGGLKIGVSTLDMAHAYETLATGGLKVYNPVLGDMYDGKGPTGIQSITCSSSLCGGPGASVTDRPTYQRVLPNWVANTEHQMLEGVVSQGGTAPMAAIPGVIVAGKTGTTSNYGDAWFVGWTRQMTTAVWVGYPNSLVPMTTAYDGAPVEGGTFPAIIWNAFMTNALQILSDEQAAKAQGRKPSGANSGSSGNSGNSGAGSTGNTGSSSQSSTSPSGGGNTGNTGGGGGNAGNTGGGGGNAGNSGGGGNAGNSGGGGNAGNSGGGGNAGNSGGGGGNAGSSGAGTGGAGIGK